MRLSPLILVAFLAACASPSTKLAGAVSPSVMTVSSDASDLATDTSTDLDLHRRACALHYQTYDPATDTFMARPGVRAKCTL